jgi:hypothetical protein
MIFLDDILVYSKSQADHVEHLRTVLQRLRDHKLYAKLSKCQFGQSSVKFLGHVVSAKGVGMDRHKVQHIRDLPALRSVKEVQQFLGLPGYYRKFIKGYSQIALLLFALLNKQSSFEWEEPQQFAFEAV